MRQGDIVHRAADILLIHAARYPGYTCLKNEGKRSEVCLPVSNKLW